MKKYIVAILLGLLLGISCKKVSSIPSQLDLHEDADFKEYVNGTYNLFSTMNLTKETRNKMPYATSKKDLQEIYGVTKYAEVEAWSSRTVVLVNGLTKKYGQLDPRIVSEQALMVLFPNNDIVLSTAPQACRKQYYTCMANVLSNAIMCHIACTSATIAAPICFLLCLTVEIHQGLDCAEQWCDKPPTKEIVTSN